METTVPEAAAAGASPGLEGDEATADTEEGASTGAAERIRKALSESGAEVYSLEDMEKWDPLVQNFNLRTASAAALSETLDLQLKEGLTKEALVWRLQRILAVMGKLHRERDLRKRHFCELDEQMCEGMAEMSGKLDSFEERIGRMEATVQACRRAADSLPEVVVQTEEAAPIETQTADMWLQPQVEHAPQPQFQPPLPNQVAPASHPAPELIPPQQHWQQQPPPGQNEQYNVQMAHAMQQSHQYPTQQAFQQPQPLQQHWPQYPNQLQQSPPLMHQQAQAAMMHQQVPPYIPQQPQQSQQTQLSQLQPLQQPYQLTQQHVPHYPAFTNQQPVPQHFIQAPPQQQQQQQPLTYASQQPKTRPPPPPIPRSNLNAAAPPFEGTVRHGLAGHGVSAEVPQVPLGGEGSDVGGDDDNPWGNLT